MNPFIDSRRLGETGDRTHRILSDADIARIADGYHAGRCDSAEGYADIPGFCKAASLDDVRGHGHVLTPGRYVGVADAVDEGEPFTERIIRLSAMLEGQLVESERLATVIRENLAGLGQ